MSERGYSPAAFDRWLTTQFDPEQAPQPRCGRCRAFLAWSPDRSVPYDEAVECDGTITIVQETYGEAVGSILPARSLFLEQMFGTKERHLFGAALRYSALSASLWSSSSSSKWSRDSKMPEVTSSS